METPPIDLAALDAEFGRRLLKLRGKRPRIRIAEAIVEQLENPPHRKTLEKHIMEIEHGQRPLTLAFAVVLCRAADIDLAELVPEFFARS